MNERLGRNGRLMLLALTAGVLGLLVLVLAERTFSQTLLGDFTVSFYRAANYLVRGENIYYSPYPNPLNGRDYPPYNPIWAVFPALPLSTWPLHSAEALRFLCELVLLPLMAYLAAQWAGVSGAGRVVLLAVAPWLAILLFAGQVSFIVFTGLLLCFWAARRADAWMMGVGLWFLLLKPHIVALVILAAVWYAWRNRILMKSSLIVLGLTLLASLAQPSWLGDVGYLIVERLKHPRLADAVLLLPGYPYAQVALLAAGVILLGVYLLRSDERYPSHWLWATLITASLVAGLHTFPYDWLNLMLATALLLRVRWGTALVLVCYVYPFIWAAFEFGFGLHVVPPTVIPLVVLLGLIGWRGLQSGLKRENSTIKVFRVSGALNGQRRGCRNQC